jgi:hypothetical protein
MSRRRGQRSRRTRKITGKARSRRPKQTGSQLRCRFCASRSDYRRVRSLRNRPTLQPLSSRPSGSYHVAHGDYGASIETPAVRAPTAEQLQTLLTRIIKRMMKLLTRRHPHGTQALGLHRPRHRLRLQCQLTTGEPVLRRQAARRRSGHTADSRVLKVCGGVGSLMRVFGQQLPVLKKRAQRRIFSGRKRKEPSLR